MVCSEARALGREGHVNIRGGSSTGGRKRVERMSRGRKRGGEREGGCVCVCETES